MARCPSPKHNLREYWAGMRISCDDVINTFSTVGTIFTEESVTCDDKSIIHYASPVPSFRVIAHRCIEAALVQIALSILASRGFRWGGVTEWVQAEANAEPAKAAIVSALIMSDSIGRLDLLASRGLFRRWVSTVWQHRYGYGERFVTSVG